MATGLEAGLRHARRVKKYKRAVSYQIDAREPAEAQLTESMECGIELCLVDGLHPPWGSGHCREAGGLGGSHLEAGSEGSRVH